MKFNLILPQLIQKNVCRRQLDYGLSNASEGKILNISIWYLLKYFEIYCRKESPNKKKK